MALTPLNFPNAPTIGQTYPSPPVTGQPTYTWDGADWISQFALGIAYVPLDGSQPMTGLLTLSGDPTAALQAGTKQYIDGGDAAAIALATGAMQGHLFGLTMSTAGASATLTVAPGAACDSTGVRLLKLAATMAKTTAAWAAGGPAGGLDTGVIAASTTYHWFLIGNPTSGAVDLVFSATTTPQNGPTLMPAGFTLFRRIGSIMTNASSQWVKFWQNGDEFLLDAPTTQLNAYTGVTNVPLAVTVGVPFGIVVNALFCYSGTNTAANSAAFVAYSPAGAAQAVAGGNFDIIIQAINSIIGTTVNVRTNTSAQVMLVSNAASNNQVYLATYGWIDSRGRLN
jgi:hypothetical protein